MNMSLLSGMFSNMSNATRVLVALLILGVCAGITIGIYFISFKIVLYVIHEIAAAIKSA